MEQIVPRHKVPLAKKCYFEGPADQKYVKRLENFLSKSKKCFWKKNLMKSFLSESPRDTWKKVFPTINIFFQKSRQFRWKSELTNEKKTRKQFFPQNLSLDTYDRLVKILPIFYGNCQKFHSKSAKNDKDNMFPQNLCIPSKLSSGLSESVFDKRARKNSSKVWTFRTRSSKKNRKLITKLEKK